MNGIAVSSLAMQNAGEFVERDAIRTLIAHAVPYLPVNRP